MTADLGEAIAETPLDGRPSRLDAFLAKLALGHIKAFWSDDG